MFLCLLWTGHCAVGVDYCDTADGDWNFYAYLPPFVGAWDESNIIKVKKVPSCVTFTDGITDDPWGAGEAIST